MPPSLQFENPEILCRHAIGKTDALKQSYPFATMNSKLRRNSQFFCTWLVALSLSAAGAPGDVDLNFHNLDLRGDLFPNPGGVSTIAIQKDGKILIGGEFVGLLSTSHTNIARLNEDGTVDDSWSPILDLGNSRSRVNSFVVQRDDKILICGSFTNVNGVVRDGIARLNNNGTLDASFDPQAGLRPSVAFGTTNYLPAVYCMALQPDGRIVVGGEFSTVGGVARANLARLNKDGSLDMGFSTSISGGGVSSLAVQPDGKIIIGGEFTSVDGLVINYLHRLNANGSSDIGYRANANSWPLWLALQPDGKLLVGGYFDSIGGASRPGFARLLSNGDNDATFNANLSGDSYVSSLALQADGKIIAGGVFTNVGGFAHVNLVRLTTNGVPDSTFNPYTGETIVYGFGGPFTVNGVSGVVLQEDGKVLVGGDFGSVNQVLRVGFARLENDPATQSLTVTSSNRIQWLRGGSSPEAMAVEFRYAHDGLSLGLLLGGLFPPQRIPGGWEFFWPLPDGGQIRGLAHVPGAGGSSSFVGSTIGYSTTSSVAVPFPDHWWPGEGNGNDAIGSAHGVLVPSDGYTTNSTTPTVSYPPGIVGQSFQYDTNGTAFNFGTQAANVGTNDFTLCFWFKSTNPSIRGIFGNQVICYYNTAWTVHIYGGPLLFGIDEYTPAYNYVADNFSATNVCDGQWHHVACVRSNLTPRIFVDGALSDGGHSGSAGGSSAGLANITNSYRFLMGGAAGNPGGNCYLASNDGDAFDEVQLYYRALATNQIAALANLQANTTAPLKPRLDITQLNSQVGLSWPSIATGFLLETNSSPILSNGWGVLTSTYGVAGTNYTVTDVNTGTTRYYRLHKP